MKVRIVLTDDGGNTYEGEATLVAPGGVRSPRKRSEKTPRATAPTQTSPDLSLPVPAFVKRYAKGLGGPQKFAVLLARLSGGKTGVTVSLKDIEKIWNRMTRFMGGKFHRMYAMRANDEGWVDTPKKGHYALRSGWGKALGE